MPIKPLPPTRRNTSNSIGKVDQHLGESGSFDHIYTTNLPHLLLTQHYNRSLLRDYKASEFFKPHHSDIEPPIDQTTPALIRKTNLIFNLFVGAYIIIIVMRRVSIWLAVLDQLWTWPNARLIKELQTSYSGPSLVPSGTGTRTGTRTRLWLETNAGPIKEP